MKRYTVLVDAEANLQEELVERQLLSFPEAQDD